MVASRAGAWIETWMSDHKPDVSKSLPVRERGLKQGIDPCNAVFQHGGHHVQVVNVRTTDRMIFHEGKRPANDTGTGVDERQVFGFGIPPDLIRCFLNGEGVTHATRVSGHGKKFVDDLGADTGRDFACQCMVS